MGIPSGILFFWGFQIISVQKSSKVYSPILSLSGVLLDFLWDLARDSCHSFRNSLRIFFRGSIKMVHGFLQDLPKEYNRFFSSIIAGVSLDISSGILSRIPSGIPSGMPLGILFGIPSRILFLISSAVPKDFRHYFKNFLNDYFMNSLGNTFSNFLWDSFRNSFNGLFRSSL